MVKLLAILLLGFFIALEVMSFFIDLAMFVTPILVTTLVIAFKFRRKLFS